VRNDKRDKEPVEDFQLPSFLVVSIGFIFGDNITIAEKQITC
jgi:hypothetical protein